MVYNSLDNCPIVIFFKVIDTGNFSLLGNGSPKELSEAWESLHNEYLEVYGVSKEFEIAKAIRLEIIQLKIDIINGDRSKEAFLFVQQQQLKELSQEKANIYKSIAVISSILGFKIDLEITIREFYEYQEIAKAKTDG